MWFWGSLYLLFGMVMTGFIVGAQIEAIKEKKAEEKSKLWWWIKFLVKIFSFVFFWPVAMGVGLGIQAAAKAKEIKEEELEEEDGPADKEEA